MDGYFWVVGGTGTSASLKAFEQTYGALKPSQHIGNLFFAFLGADKVVAPKVVGSYVGGFGTGPGLKTRQAKAYEAVVAKHYPGLNGGNYADGFVYNYYNAAWALVQGLTKSAVSSGSRSSRRCRARSSRATRSPTTVSSGSTGTGRRSRTSTRCRSSKTGNTIGTAVVGYVPNVDQSFGGLFKRTSPPPGRTQPPCVKKKTPWQGKIKVVKNGVITNQTLK